MRHAPYTVELDHDEAIRMAQLGATFLFLGVPQGSVVSIDQQTFVVGPQFQGVKMLPAGPHFVAYSAVSKQKEVSPPVWFFVHVKAGDVLCRQWDSHTELLLPLGDAEEADRYAAGVKRFDFDKGLAPYNLQARASWQQLASCLTAKLISRLAPAGLGQCSITAEEDFSASGPQTAAEQRLEAQLAAKHPAAQVHAVHQDSDSDPGTKEHLAVPSDDSGSRADVGTARYTRIPRLVKEKGRTPQELTQLNLDKSGLLSRYLDQFAEPAELVGEFQYTFIAFLMGQSLAGFMQWKAILHLALQCGTIVAAETQLFLKLLGTLHAQLCLALQPEQAHSSGAQDTMTPLFMEGLLESNFLQPLLASFSDHLDDLDCLDVHLLDQMAQLTLLLQQRLGWSFDRKVDIDDDAPVVVEL